MEKYEVTILSRRTYTLFPSNKWSMEFQADNFAHAEEQAIEHLEDADDEIITIAKDYA